MPGVAELLNRLRPVVAPGADAPSAVPADRRHEAESQLAEVFAVVADVQREADRIRATATARAGRILRDADRRAGQFVERATRQADSVRAEAGAAERVDAARSRRRCSTRSCTCCAVNRADSRTGRAPPWWRGGTSRGKRTACCWVPSS